MSVTGCFTPLRVGWGRQPPELLDRDLGRGVRIAGHDLGDSGRRIGDHLEDGPLDRRGALPVAVERLEDQCAPPV